MKNKKIGGAAKITDFWHLLVEKLGGNEKLEPYLNQVN